MIVASGTVVDPASARGITLVGGLSNFGGDRWGIKLGALVIVTQASADSFGLVQFPTLTADRYTTGPGASIVSTASNAQYCQLLSLLLIGRTTSTRTCCTS